MTGFTSLSRLVLAAAFSSAVLCQSASAADEVTDICLKNGILLRARIDTRDGKFFVYVPGKDAATDMTGMIHSVGVPEDPVCKGLVATPAPTAVPIKEQTAEFGIRGSNTIGERLMPMLIEAYATKAFGAPPASKNLEPEHLTIEIKRPEAPKPAAVIDFRAEGSGTAPPALKAHQIEIGMMSRRIKPEEATDIQAAQSVDPRLPDSEHVVALDGLAVIVNENNPIKKLTLTQVAQIFAGEIDNWRDVKGRNKNNEEISGPDLPIRLHARDDKSGTYDTFKNVVLEREEPKRKLSPAAARYKSSEELSAAVSKDAGAVGFIGFPYINRNTPIRMMSACGIESEPSNFTVKLETYPLARRLFLYTLGTPNDRIVKSLVDYALSDEAQKTVIEAGFIDQNVENQPLDAQQRFVSLLEKQPVLALPAGKAVPQHMGTQFMKSVAGMRRTSIVFRFQRNESGLDTLARQNVGRLGRYLAPPARPGRKVLLIGFADSDGSWETNLGLAKARARSVAEELQSLGIKLPPLRVLSLSYMAPVACNDSDSGRALNRRVEVWISN
ncbi:MAG: substrate-binding domain-containing protein [Rhodomicrobium sp.]